MNACPTVNGRSLHLLFAEAFRVPPLESAPA